MYLEIRKPATYFCLRVIHGQAVYRDKKDKIYTCGF